MLKKHSPRLVTLPIGEYEKRVKLLNYEASTKEKSEDYLNNFIYLDQDKRAPGINIMTGPMWTDTGIADDQDFMMGSIANQRLPISAGSDSTSTSRDINAFKATLTDYHNVERNYLLLDTEGTGGSHYPAIKGSDKASIDGQERKQFVNKTYPRLLYLFSNVLVFVFDADPRQKGTILENLVDYAYTEARKSANQFLRPHLIVIFNKVKGNPELDISKSTNAFLEDIVTEPLRVLFQSINVINIPKGDSNIVTYTHQVVELEKLIKIKLTHSIESKSIARLNNTRQFIMKNMTAAISKFSHSPEAFIDFFDLEACFQPVGESLSDFIYMYFIVAYHQYEKNRSTWNPILDYNLAIESTRHRVTKYYQDHLSLHAITEENTESLRQAIKDALVHIEKWAPCGYKFGSGFYCSFKKHTHEGVFIAHTPAPTSLVDIDFNTGTGRWLDRCRITTIIEHNKHLYRVCIGCIKNVPTQTLACGHVLCVDCCEKLPGQCWICKQRIDWISKEPPKSAGYRLLSLCGGGIPGVVECVILKEIQTLVHDIPIVKLFDLIVGTGAGGLVALALATNNYTPEQGIEIFEHLGKEIFVGKFGTGIPLISGIISKLHSGWNGMYDREKLHNALALVIPATSLIQSSKDVKVAVPSVTTEDGKLKIRLFGSYNRQEHSDYQLDFSSSCLDAAEATSAATGYFPPFISSQEIVYTDGGMMANNPCVIALEEGKLLWKDQQCDLLSIFGTGTFPQSHTLSGISSLAKTHLDQVTDCEAKSNTAKMMLESTSTLLFDVNTKFDRIIELDEVDSLPTLISEASSKAMKDEEIKRLSHKLLATLFYIDVKDHDNKLYCTIKSRVNPLPESIIKQFETSSMFTVFTKDKVIKVQQQPNTTGPFGIKLSLDVPPTVDLTLDVRCHLQCTDLSANESSISGCPKTIIRKKVNTDY
eukprot:gene14493-17104_t